MAIVQTALTGIDLSSLEEIRGFGVAVLQNHNLCYFGNIVRAIENSSYANVFVQEIACGELLDAKDFATGYCTYVCT